MFNWIQLSHSCARGLLIGFNVLIIFVAVCTLCCAAVDLAILTQYGEEAGGSTSADIVIIVVCCFVVLVAVMGCVGTVKGNEKILYCYVMVLSAFVLLEVILGIFVSVERYGLQWRVTDWLRDDFYSNDTDVQLWDKLQSLYQCCGLNGPEDYAAMNRSISLSCCQVAHLARNKIAQKNMYSICLQAKSYFSIGCENEILTLLQSAADFLFGAAVTAFGLS